MLYVMYYQYNYAPGLSWYPLTQSPTLRHRVMYGSNMHIKCFKCGQNAFKWHAMQFYSIKYLKYALCYVLSI